MLIGFRRQTGEEAKRVWGAGRGERRTSQLSMLKFCVSVFVHTV